MNKEYLEDLEIFENWIIQESLNLEERKLAEMQEILKLIS